MRNLFDDRFHDPLFGLTTAVAGDAPDEGESIVGTDGRDQLKGTAGDDTIKGLGGDDVITGKAGSDSMLGGGGADWIFDEDSGSDSLFGGGGDDSLTVRREFSSPPTVVDKVLIDGGDGGDILYVHASSADGIDYALEATLLGGEGDDQIIVGVATQVSVDAGAGDDYLQITIGDGRILTLGDGADIVEFVGRQGAPDALVITDFQTGDSGDTLRLRDSLLPSLLQYWDRDNPFGEGYLRLVQRDADTVMQIDEDGGGDGWSDLIVFQQTQKSAFTAFNLDGYPPSGEEPPGELFTGTEADDTLSGTNGADTLVGLGGNDWLFGDVSDDLLLGGEGDDFLDGSGGKDTLDGGAGNDGLFGYAGELLLGGDGDDGIGVYLGAGPGAAATLHGNAGDDQLQVDFSSLPGQGEALVYGDEGNDTITVQGTGPGRIDGGDGDDLFVLTNPSSEIVLTLGDGRDVVRIQDAAVGDTAVQIVDFMAGASGDRLEIYDFLKDNLTGWDFTSNPFAGGFLRLVARGGGSLLQWRPAGEGAWGDLFLLRGVQPAALTQENLGGYPSDGSDPTGLAVTGGRADDTLIAANGPDTVNGGKGFDHLYGAAGDDHLFGGLGNDTLYGGYGADVMDGGAGDDLLIGSDGGADTLMGGAGDDDLALRRYEGSPVEDGLIVFDGGLGDDYITYGADNLAREQVSMLGGSGNDWLRIEQNVAAVTIEGGDGDDTITGGYGAMTIDGGAGDDFVSVQAGEPPVRVALGAGSDLIEIKGSFVFFFSGEPVEVVDFSPKDRLGLRHLVSGEFGDVNNPFNDGYLRLAQVGADTVLQGVQADGDWVSLLRLDGVTASKLTSAQLDGYKTGPIWTIGTDQDDSLQLHKGFTHLDAGDGADTVKGSEAADTIIGGEGADVLTGRGGNDTFKYNSTADSPAGSADRINDLTDADKIDLSRVDADSLTFGDQAFHLVGGFTGQAGELTVSYDSHSRLTTIAGDVNGDGAADVVITVSGDHHDFDHFVL